MEVSRRNFIVSTSAAAAGAYARRADVRPGGPRASSPRPARLRRTASIQKDPALKYDLVIANGEVLDPSQKPRASETSGIKYGQIAAVETSIPAARAVQRIDAAGKLVTPGLVDLHTHLVPHLGIGRCLADEMVGITAVTTAVSAGDAGWQTFGAVRHYAIPQARTRIFAFVHIASIGLAGGLAPGEMLNIDYANVDGCAKAVIGESRHRARREGARSPTRWSARTASSRCGGRSAPREMVGKGVPVMCHIGAAPGALSDLLDLLRPGDILTHAYSGAGNNTVQNGQLLPAAKRGQAARSRLRRRPRWWELRLHGVPSRRSSRARCPTRSPATSTPSASTRPDIRPCPT